MLAKVLGSGPSKRILDLGCGTGEHSRYLAGQGFEVVGVDASASMIASAREGPEVHGMHFVEGDLAEIAEMVEGEFGGALCLGNTLPHLLLESQLEAMLDGLRRLLAPGAPLLVQLLNYERIFHRGERYLPLSFRSEGDEEIVFLRLMELQDDGHVLFFPSTLRLVPDGEPPLEVRAAKRVRLRGWRAAELVPALEKAGFGQHRLLGDYAGTAFAPLESADLIFIAR